MAACAAATYRVDDEVVVRGAGNHRDGTTPRGSANMSERVPDIVTAAQYLLAYLSLSFFCARPQQVK